jgi:hypothetical protein
MYTIILYSSTAYQLLSENIWRAELRDNLVRNISSLPVIFKLHLWYER